MNPLATERRVSGGDEPDAARMLERFKVSNFEIREISSAADRAAYLKYLEHHYAKLGFMSEWVLPSNASRQFFIYFSGEMVGLFRLTEVSGASSIFHERLPESTLQDARLLELNNVLIGEEFRSGPALGLILYRSACEAHAGGFDFVVGLTRIQVLRFMVDFGVIPAEHPPLSAMGKDHLKDFVTYFDTRSQESIAYMHERAKRYFHQEFVMKCIREKYLRPMRRSEVRIGAEPAGLPVQQPALQA